MKKIIITLVIASGLICVLPFPQRVRLDMKGRAAQIYATDGQEAMIALSEPVTMDIKGWHFHFCCSMIS